MELCCILKEYARSNSCYNNFLLFYRCNGSLAQLEFLQVLAETMSGMAFAQMINPGAPVVFGSFASSISMQSGAPTFGTPEPAIVFTVQNWLED